jgi:hypothetical protein
MSKLCCEVGSLMIGKKQSPARRVTDVILEGVERSGGQSWHPGLAR